MLAGCATRPAEPVIQFRDVKVAVPTGCVVDRPVPIAPLKQQVPVEEWAQRAIGAKAEAMRAQAGRRMNNAEQLGASTSTCRDAPAN